MLGGSFTYDDLRHSVFCLAPSGWGWGWRLSLAMLTQCVPVIIQPNVTQPFEELIPYDDFALRLQLEDVPRLGALLRGTSAAQVCRWQRALARYYRAILWQQPFGPQFAGAYELTQVTLCRRAMALAARMAASGASPQAWLARNCLACPDSLKAARISF